MEIPYFKPSDYIRNLSILHIAIVVGVVVFMLISVCLNVFAAFDGGLNEMKDLLLVIFLVFGAGCFFASKFMFRKKLKSAKTAEDLNQKLYEYRAAYVSKLAILEAPAFAGGVFYLLANDFLILAVAMVMTLLLVFQKPSKDSVVRDLELSIDEAVRLERPDQGV